MAVVRRRFWDQYGLKIRTVIFGIFLYLLVYAVLFDIEDLAHRCKLLYPNLFLILILVLLGYIIYETFFESYWFYLFQAPVGTKRMPAIEIPEQEFSQKLKKRRCVD